MLLRAINNYADSTILINEDTARAVCHEVVDRGPEVTKVNVHDHVLHISTAADAADYGKWEKKEAKYLFCHEDDVVAVWNFDDAIEATKNLQI